MLARVQEAKRQGKPLPQNIDDMERTVGGTSSAAVRAMCAGQTGHTVLLSLVYTFGISEALKLRSKASLLHTCRYMAQLQATAGARAAAGATAGWQDAASCPTQQRYVHGPTSCSFGALMEACFTCACNAHAAATFSSAARSASRMLPCRAHRPNARGQCQGTAVPIGGAACESQHQVSDDTQGLQGLLRASGAGVTLCHCGLRRSERLQGSRALVESDQKQTSYSPASLLKHHDSQCGRCV